MFSERTAWDLSENEFAARVREVRSAGVELIDLTQSNPTHCGFRYPAELLEPLSEPGAREYEPDPLGMVGAREAVTRYYADSGASMEAGRICLTTSTSEAYSFLFRLLCDPGDEVLIARPSYPLFEHIARLDGVVLREYPLHYDPGAGAALAHAWPIDFEAIERRITERTRAMVVVHPNNPTGQYASQEERLRLRELCRRHQLALIVDEVFLDYGLAGGSGTFAAEPSEALTFVLSGLSKVCALPQMKASWVVATGPGALVSDAMARLEMIADTFLSMNAPVQYALPTWLAGRHAMQRQIVARLRTNLAALDRRLEGSAAQRLAMEAGWTAILRVPRVVDGVPFAEAALNRGVLVQPGEFYGMNESRVVVSLLTPEEQFQQGLERLPVEAH